MTDPIPLSEAARIASTTPEVLRKHINQGLLKSTKDERGRHLVRRDDVLLFFAERAVNRSPARTQPRSPSITTASVPEGSPLREQIALLERQIDQLDRSLDRERRVNDEFRDQIKRLESEIFKLSHEMQALLSKDSPTGVLSRWVKSKIAP